MSARVLNPATMMTEMSRSLGVIVASNNASSVASGTPPGMSSAGAGGGGGGGTGRVVPSRAALAKVRRDLFGPVDHAAARALAESELRAQSILDAERWGFDFRLEVPKSGSRFEWQVITSEDCVPEPYALRGMPYLRKQSPPSPRKSSSLVVPRSPRLVRIASGAESPTRTTTTTTTLVSAATTLIAPTPVKLQERLESERTPPQESRAPSVPVETTPEVVPAIAELSFRSKEKRSFAGKQQPTTPARRAGSTSPLTPVQSRKQASITDFMKSRKRTLNGSAKSVIEPPAKVSRKAGQIHS